jgi:hypothetical protein
MSEEHYSDNVFVGLRGGGSDFLGVILKVSEEWGEESVLLYRYVLPGRTDIYSFGWMPSHGAGRGSRVTLFSDYNRTLPQALRLVRRDLDRPQVVKMLMGLAKKVPLCMYRDLVENLLPSIGTGSKSLRACRKILREADQRVRQALKARREARAQEVP